MKAIRIDKFVENYDEISVSETPLPQCEPGELLVRVEAAGLNFVDLLYARGKHQNNRTIKPPFIIGLEFAGTIVWSEDATWPKGCKVFGSASQGAFAEYIKIRPSILLHRLPRKWTLIEAAGLAATAPVSYGALITQGKLCAGQTVLIHGAAGGLGLMAIQIAKAIGAHVIATVGTAKKLIVTQRFGADESVLCSDDKWPAKVLELTGGSGVDIVYDPVGLVERSLKCIKHRGTILIIGFAGSGGTIERIPTNRVLLKQVKIVGYRYGESDRRYPEETAAIWKDLTDMLQSGTIKATVYDQTFHGLESVPVAMKALANRKVWGKAIIRLDGDLETSKL